MAMTITEKIIASHAGVDRVRPGDFVEASVDQTWSDDLGSPLTMGLLEEHGLKVWDTSRVFVTSMVNSPAQSIQTATVLKNIRGLTGRLEIPLYEMGKAAIHNALGIEIGKT